MNLFVFGMGYSGLASARALRARHPSSAIAGTSRTSEGAQALTRQGFTGHVFSGESPGETLGEDLRAATHTVLSIAPGPAGDPALLHHRAELDAAQDLEWLCYYSTIGVYGDHGGDWIDETAPLRATSERNRRRIAAEAEWRGYALERGVPLCILRLAGIYGPGRSAFEKIASGTAHRIVKPEQVFNRIHVEDIARVSALAAEARLAGTYNLADDLPAPPQDVVACAAELAGVAPPPEIPFETADLTPMQRSFYADNKRVSNAGIKDRLAIALLHPDYRQGLAAIHSGG
ncbi:SDR family oxidoreductase [Devosia nitrariae]|uniref:NAD(P)-dependent oxidoreductase n=1 Tax=Devosia nitrariae TaxID=2071872 RepID=A0ABQ5W0T9_9HYPH|nr:SDR family oxidoreductase [Devosia nitrariae]GLQ53429.1 NAD(P)-dependent oxidoreductase [Devosia nitrariae]